MTAMERRLCVRKPSPREGGVSYIQKPKAPIGGLDSQVDAGSTPGQARAADGGSKLPHSTWCEASLRIGGWRARAKQVCRASAAADCAPTNAEASGMMRWRAYATGGRLQLSRGLRADPQRGRPRSRIREKDAASYRRGPVSRVLPVEWTRASSWRDGKSAPSLRPNFPRAQNSGARRRRRSPLPWCHPTRTRPYRRNRSSAFGQFRGRDDLAGLGNKRGEPANVY